MLRFPRVEEEIMDLNSIIELFNEKKFKKMMESNIAHILCRTDKKTKFFLTTETSEIYTDGNEIVVGLPKEYEGKTYGQIYSMVKACVGHESAHVRWSNFHAIKGYLNEVKKKNINTSLGHSMFNIIEDGRIERLLCEDLPGYTKHIQLLNSQLIKKDGNLRDSGNVLGNIIGIIHFLAVLGIYPKNYNDLLESKERNIIETQIHPLVLKGVMTNSYHVVQEVCLKILELLKDYIPEQKSMPQELIDLLEALAQETYQSSEGENGEDADNLDEMVNMVMQNIKRQMSSSSSSNNNSGEDDKQEEQDGSEFSSSGDSSDFDREQDDSKEGKSDYKNNDVSEEKSSDDKSNKKSNELDNASNEENVKEQNKSSNGDTPCEDNKEKSEQKMEEKSENDNSENGDKNDNSETSGSSDSDNSDSDRNSEDEKISNLLPSHFKCSEGEVSSKEHEDEFLENLIKEVEKEAQRAFEKIEKEEKRDKYDNANSFHAGINVDEINDNYSSDKQEPNFEFIYPNIPCKKPQEEFKMKIHGLKKVFEKILKNEEKHYKGQKRGRLDTSRLWRTSVNDVNIFKKKSVVEKIDYVIEILIDVSGSMWDKVKYKNALGTAICIESALSDLEGVKVKTVAFNFHGETKMMVLKDFADKESKTPTVYESDITSGSNRDGFAIRVALQDLKKQNAKNKLLIIISDGMPNARPIETSHESIADVKDAVHKGRKEATIVGILINDGPIDSDTKDVFHYMYEDKGSILVDVVNEPEDIMKNVVLYLKKMFKR